MEVNAEIAKLREQEKEERRRLEEEDLQKEIEKQRQQEAREQKEKAERQEQKRLEKIRQEEEDKKREFERMHTEAQEAKRREREQSKASQKPQSVESVLSEEPSGVQKIIKTVSPVASTQPKIEIEQPGQDGVKPVTLEEIKSFLKDFTHPYLYLAPGIPINKVHNVIAKYAPKVLPQDVLLLFDNTVFGSATDGFCLSPYKVCWHNIWESPMQISYSEIRFVEFKKGFAGTGAIVVNHNEIYINLGTEEGNIIEMMTNLIAHLTDKRKGES